MFWTPCTLQPLSTCHLREVAQSRMRMLVYCCRLAASSGQGIYCTCSQITYGSADCVWFHNTRQQREGQWADPAQGLEEAEEDGGVEAIGEGAGAHPPEEGGGSPALGHDARGSRHQRRPAARAAHHHRLHHVQRRRGRRRRRARRTPDDQILHHCRLRTATAITTLARFLLHRRPIQ